MILARARLSVAVGTIRLRLAICGIVICAGESQGYGAQLLQTAEQIAVERGCVGIWLDTFSFQAPSFYGRHGYTVFGTLHDHPRGKRHFFLTKLLKT